MSRKGRVKLSLQENTERKEFILSRLRSGFPRLDVQRQFAKKFDYSIESARTWLNKTCDELIDTDINNRRRTFAVIVEMYHGQITAYQNELLAMQREIDKITDAEDQRKLLVNQLEVAEAKQISSIQTRLAILPEPKLTDKAYLIEAKTRVRERLFRVISELSRLQGMSDQLSDWRNALSILLDNNLVPGTIADKILQAIEHFEFDMQSKINSVNEEVENAQTSNQKRAV